MQEANEERIRRAVMLFLCTHRRHKRVLDGLVAEFEISNTQHRLLMHLYRTECKPTQTELARTFDVSTAAITSMLKKLEAEELISRNQSAEDNRFNCITITSKGMEMISRTREQFFCVDRAMFSDFTSEELETFITGLEKMGNTLKELEEGHRKLSHL
jgi:DNA-binding MarR family transcriptional regulator